jgi:hypothetical protein
MLEIERFDFGNVPNSELHYRNVKIQNTGSDDLRITSVDTALKVCDTIRDEWKKNSQHLLL